MTLMYEPWLVALSLLVAFQGSYVGLHLARQVQSARGTRQRTLITGSALSLALGIWSMHFVGMLAIRLPAAVSFLALPTLLSFLVCVLVVGFAVYAVGTQPPSLWTESIAALAMGGGIVTMHYLGMFALHDSMHMVHDARWVAASIVIGITASGFALWLGFGSGARRPVLISAVLMALAISAMHYTAMAGVMLHPHAPAAAATAPALSAGLLALIVAVVAFVVSGLFLLTLVPETEPAATLSGHGVPAGDSEPNAAGALDAQPAGFRDALENGSDPLATPSPTAPAGPGGLLPRTLPVEKDGRRRQFDLHDLVAVQAQAHYTTLFDGETTWFCPMPISEVEARLDPLVFARIHRSHIVNLDHVAALRRKAEAGFVAMSARIPYRAPVSRSRRSWLKQRLDERSADLPLKDSPAAPQTPPLGQSG